MGIAGGLWRVKPAPFCLFLGAAGGVVATDAILTVVSDIPVFSYISVIDNQSGVGAQWELPGCWGA